MNTCAVQTWWGVLGYFSLGTGFGVFVWWIISYFLRVSAQEAPHLQLTDIEIHELSTTLTSLTNPDQTEKNLSTKFKHYLERLDVWHSTHL